MTYFVNRDLFPHFNASLVSIARSRAHGLLKQAHLSLIATEAGVGVRNRYDAALHREDQSVQIPSFPSDPRAMDYIERALSYMVMKQRGRDHDLFTRQVQFKNIRPSIDITSPISNHLPLEYIDDVKGGNRFPPLRWKNPPGTKEVILIMQDADGPVPYAVAHGIYYGIPPSIEAIESEFFDQKNPTFEQHGIRLGKNLIGVVYAPPHPLMNHGPHRYFYQIIALGRPLEGLKPKWAKYNDILAKIRSEDIVGWGEWVGSAERSSK